MNRTSELIQFLVKRVREVGKNENSLSDEE